MVCARVSRCSAPLPPPRHTPLTLSSLPSSGHHLHELNETSGSVLPLEVSVAPAAMWAWAMQTQMAAQWEMQESWGSGGGDGETDMIKGILVETNPILLAVTLLVTTLHTLFDFLAFKNDIS